MCSRIAALISVFVFLIDGSLLFAQNARPSVTSPDGQLKKTFEVNPSDNTPGTMGQLTYSATFHGKPIIDSSRLGLDLEGAAVLGADVEIAEARQSSGVDEYSLRNTKVSKVHDTYNSITLRVNEKGSHSRSLLLEARA